MITGKSSISLRKQDLHNQTQPAVGLKKLSFYHEATAGDTGINLTALSLPSEMTGYTNPTSSELTAANLLFFKRNLLLTSSSKGLLIPEVSYKVTSNSQIVFTESFGTAEDGEIFHGIVDPVLRSDSLVADTDFMVATGTLAANATDISLGRAFKTNKNSAEQLGAVMVFVDGQLLFRNVANATAAPAADGDYEELDNGFGEFTVVRLNVADTLNARPYLVVSSVLSTISPDGSIRDLLEAQQGTVDSLVEHVALLAGVPTTNIQATPSQPQLKQFGDRVVALEEPTLMDDTLATKLGHKTYFHGTTYNGGNAPTITLSSGGGSLSGTPYAAFTPKQMQDGSWECDFKITVGTTVTARTSLVLAINGLVFADVGSSLGQAVSGYIGLATPPGLVSRADNNANVVTMLHSSASSGGYSFSGNVRLASKPTWAY